MIISLDTLEIFSYLYVLQLNRMADNTEVNTSGSTRGI